MKHRAFAGLMALAIVVATVPAAAEEMGSIVIFTEHIDEFSSLGYAGGVDISLSGFDNVSDVSVEIDNGVSSETYTLFEHDPGVWAQDYTFDSLDDLKATVDGTWTVVIKIGPSDTDKVESTFAVNADLIVADNYLDPPTGVIPADGDDNVAGNVVFEWMAPDHASSAAALFVEVERDNGNDLQEAISLDDDIAVGDTFWDPPEDLSDGFNEFTVGYVKFGNGNENLISDIAVDMGTINWQLPFELSGSGLWPDNKPLFTFEGVTTVGFDVVPEPTTITFLGLGGVLLARRRTG